MGPDVHDLRTLVDGYAVAADEGDGAAFAALFAHGAELVVLAADGSERSRYAGPAAIGEVPGKLARYDETVHLVSTHRSHIEGDDATGVTYCEAHHLSGDADRVLLIRYDDRYTRTGDGWRFRSRTVRTIREEQR